MCYWISSKYLHEEIFEHGIAHHLTKYTFTIDVRLEWYEHSFDSIHSSHG